VNNVVLIPFLILALSAAALVTSQSLAKTTDGPAAASVLLDGRWNTPKDGGVVEISTKDGTSVGKLVASTNPKAPLGTILLRDITKRSDNAWKGKLYSPKHDRTLSVWLSLEGDTLKLRISAGLMKKTVLWTRAK